MTPQQLEDWLIDFALMVMTGEEAVMAKLLYGCGLRKRLRLTRLELVA